MSRYAGRAAAAAAAVTLLLVSACSARGAAVDAAAQPPSPVRTLTVFAAASLQTPFEEVGAAFEDSHPGVTVRFGFGGSSGLVAQLAEGAPGDVLATADEATMTTAAREGLLDGEPATLATNTLQIAVPRGNPAGVQGIADLDGPDVRVVLCAPAVPCGAAGLAVAKAAGVDLRPVSEEQSVTDVLGKVRSGEADAGLVYRTDVAGAAGEVEGIDVPESEQAVNTYRVAALEDASDPGLARAFVDTVLGPVGDAALRRAGFGAPPR